MHAPQKKISIPRDPATTVMLRKRVRTNKVDLRRLFDTLKSLRNERSALIELPPPTATQDGSPAPQNIRKWESVEAMEHEDITDDNEPNIRVFQQNIELPKLLKQPLESLSETPILDAATGLDAAVTTKKGLSKVDLHLLRKLTNALTFFAHSPLSVSKEVFHWLQQFRSNPKVLQLLTPHAWTILWALETDLIPSFRSKLIGDLMVAAGVEMTEEQEIGYIGGLFWNNAKEKAMKRWMNKIKTGKASPAFWNVGIRMMSLDQKPDVAKHWAGVMVKTLGTSDVKTWIPIIMSYNHINEPSQARRAYKSMLKWSEKTKEKIKMSQYDDICMSFLDGGDPAMGLEIYKHAVYSGSPALERMQTDIYEYLSPAVLAAQDTKETPEALNKFSVSALRELPPKIADKYFYGSWMRNLMRMGRTDLAWHLVRNVMIQRGFMLDSVHLNWIIQGFLEEENIEMAEGIAKEMIQMRLRNLEMKKEDWKDWSGKETPTAETETKDSDTTTTWSILDPSITPPATIQTFSLLINYYARRQRMEKVVDFASTMASCQLLPNSYIFNHFIYSLFRVHDLPRLARTYSIMLASEKGKPDMETWHIMWVAMTKRYTRKRTRFSEFPTPRVLFADMIKYLPRGRMLGREGDEEKMIDIWHNIIRSFMLARDFPGTLVALHAGKRIWGMEVDETIVRDIALGILKSRSWDPQLSGMPKVYEKMVVDSVEQLGVLGQRFLGRRRRRRGVKGEVGMLRRVKDPEGLLEGLTVMFGERATVREMLESTKNEMGVGGLTIS